MCVAVEIQAIFRRAILLTADSDFKMVYELAPR